MSADSIVPDPLDGQSFNRYTYVRNRPLSATDPSGHDDVATYVDKITRIAQMANRCQADVCYRYDPLGNLTQIGSASWKGGEMQTVAYWKPQISAKENQDSSGSSGDKTSAGGKLGSEVTELGDGSMLPDGQGDTYNAGGFNDGVYHPGSDAGQLIPVVHPVPFVVTQKEIDAGKQNLANLLKGFSGKPLGPFTGKLNEQQANKIAGEIIDNLDLLQARTLQGIQPVKPGDPLTINQAQFTIIQSQVRQLTPDVGPVAQAALQSALQSGSLKVTPK